MSRYEKGDKFIIEIGDVYEKVTNGTVEKLYTIKPFKWLVFNEISLSLLHRVEDYKATIYGYPIEHLEMIARVMAKENCTPEDVVRVLQDAGAIAKMVRDEILETIERSCIGESNETD